MAVVCRGSEPQQAKDARCITHDAGNLAARVGELADLRRNLALGGEALLAPLGVARHDGQDLGLDALRQGTQARQHAVKRGWGRSTYLHLAGPAGVLFSCRGSQAWPDKSALPLCSLFLLEPRLLLLGQPLLLLGLCLFRLGSLFLLALDLGFLSLTRSACDLLRLLLRASRRCQRRSLCCPLLLELLLVLSYRSIDALNSVMSAKQHREPLAYLLLTSHKSLLRLSKASRSRLSCCSERMRICCSSCTTSSSSGAPARGPGAGVLRCCAAAVRERERLMRRAASVAHEERLALDKSEAA